MKKAFFTLLAFLMVTASTYAQEGVKVGFRLSPLIGFASLSQESDGLAPPGIESKAAMGFMADFVVTTGFTENIGFKTGLNIGSRVIKMAGFGFESSLALTTLEIPIGLKFRSPEIGDGIFIIGHFGANNELNLSKKVTTGDIVDKTPEGVNLYTVSFVPGAGVDWQFDWGMLEFAATYHLGLMSTTKPEDFGDIRTKISYIALNLGYFF